MPEPGARRRSALATDAEAPLGLSHRYVAQSALGYETLGHDVAGMGPEVIPRAQLDAVVPAASYHGYGVLQGGCHGLFRQHVLSSGGRLQGMPAVQRVGGSDKRRVHPGVFQQIVQGVVSRRGAVFLGEGLRPAPVTAVYGDKLLVIGSGDRRSDLEVRVIPGADNSPTQRHGAPPKDISSIDRPVLNISNSG